MFTLVCVSFSARSGSTRVRPNLRNKTVRASYVKRLKQKSGRKKAKAREWAKKHGEVIRYDDGIRLVELVSFENGRPMYYTTDNADAAISTAADLVRNTWPYNAGGIGLTIGIWDGGSVLYTHQEFDGRVSVMDGASSHYHSTHVGGTIGASGVVASAMGMAPLVNIDSYDWDSDTTEMGSRAMSYPAEPGAIQISSHSYGLVSGWYDQTTPPRWYGQWGYRESDQFGQYDDNAAEWDQICYDYPYFLPFKSSGNDRNDDAPSEGTTFQYFNGISWVSKSYDSSTDPYDDGWDNGGFDTISLIGNAKNIMTVGAVYDAVSSGSRDIGQADMASFSSWGPTDDGRIKPDIVANGTNLYSTDNGNNSDYTTLSGTSMAAPNASGSAMLLVDVYNQRYPGQAMRSSTLKALILHTADDLGNPGPDYSYGWGLMNT
ncbi:MAG: S8 family serine peptidase, partial [Phycisphaerales bacterium]